jgi:hypothetical protein
MELPTIYRRRTVTADDANFLRQLIADHPGASRRALSFLVSDAWNWRQDNGEVRDAVCRGLMLKLQRAELIELPPPQWRSFRPAQRHRKPEPIELDQTPIVCSLADLGELTITQVRRTSDEPMVDGLIEEHHYLGYTRPVGEHLKYLIRAGERPVACMTWSSAPKHLAARDRHIGWSAEMRKTNIRFVVYNGRFLILPWVEVKNLASHLLGRMTRMLPAEWERTYGHPVYFAETFVDTTLHRGTCYRAANWVPMGITTGRGPTSNSHTPNRTKKEVLGLPLHRRFHELLQQERS